MYAIMGHLTDNLSMPLRPNRIDALELLFDVLVERLKTYRDFLLLARPNTEQCAVTPHSMLSVGIVIRENGLLMLLEILIKLHNVLSEANDLFSGFVETNKVPDVVLLIDAILLEVDKLKKLK